MCTLLTARWTPLSTVQQQKFARPLHVASAAGHQVRASRKCGMLPRPDAIVVVESESVKLGIKPEEFVIILMIMMTLLVRLFSGPIKDLSIAFLQLFFLVCFQHSIPCFHHLQKDCPQAVAAYLLRRSADISSLSKRKAEHHKVWTRGTPQGLWFSICFSGTRDALRGMQVYI